MPQVAGIAEQVHRPVDGDNGLRPEGFEARDRDRGPDGVGLGAQEGTEAVEAGGEVRDRGGHPEAAPGDPRAVGLGVGVGILPGHQLEGVHALRGELVLEGDAVPVAGVLIQADPAVVIVDMLRGVGVQGALIDVGAVGRLGRIRGEEPLDDRACRGVRGERGALVGLGNEDVPVDAAAQLLLAAVESQEGAAPEGRAEGEAVVVVVGRLYVARLEERPRAEDAVLMGFVRRPVHAAARKGGDVQRGCGRVAELGAEIIALGAELADDRGGRAQPDVQFLEGVVVHQVEGNVLVAAALAGRRVRMAEKIQLDALARLRRLIRERGLGLERRQEQEHRGGKHRYEAGWAASEVPERGLGRSDKQSS